MRLLAVALVVVLVSGCSQPDRHFTVPDDAPSSVDVASGQGYTLRVQVVDMEGTPVAGAAVVLFLDATGAVSFAGSAAAGQLEAEWRFRSDDDVVAGLRSDARGLTAAEIEPHGSIHVAAGGLPGLTTELRPNVAVGGPGDEATLTIVLYPADRTVAFDAVVDNSVGSAGLSDPASQLFPILFDAQQDDAFHARLDAARITLTWTNFPTQVADLYVGLAAGQDAPFAVGQDRQQLDVGAQTEVVEATRQDIAAHRAALAQGRAQAAVLTDRAGLGIDGVQVTFTVEADFRGSNVVIS